MSTNYSSTYNIGQSGNLYALQDHGTGTGLAQYNSTRGTTVNSPVNYRPLKAFRGLDAEFYFYLKNQDRKPLPIQGMTITATLIDRSTNTRILIKKCVNTDEEMGTCRLVLREAEISNIENGMYDIILSYENDRGLSLPLFVDQNMRPNYTLEISGVAHQIPLTSQTDDVFLLNGDHYYGSGLIKGPSSFYKPNALVTMAVYTTNYSGQFFLQGTTSQYPTESDWFEVEIGAAVDWYLFTNYTGVEPFSFHSNLKFMRVKWEVGAAGNGTVDKVVFRL